MIKASRLIVAAALNAALVSCYFGDTSEADRTTVIAPKINIRSGFLTLASGGTYDTGKVATGTERPVLFVIENLGRDYLFLNGSPQVQVNGADAPMFVVASQPSSPISPFAYRNFSIMFKPSTDGVKTATVNILNNDPDVGSFTFTITGEGDPNLVQEINLRQGVTDIPSGTGSYGFGSTQVGSPVGPVTFTIQNTGTANLTVNSVTKGGTDPGEFTLDTSGLTSPVVPGGTTTFAVGFNPASTGGKSAVITIASDDTDEGSYAFTIIGTGTAVPVQDIHLTQSGIYLPDGSGIYEFGKIIQGSSSATIQFTVTNNGTANLGIASFADSNPTDFNASFPGTPLSVIPTGTQTFTVQFTPSTSGILTSTITVNNDDPDENPYTFTVRGEGIAIPEMDILQGVTPVTSGVSTHPFGSKQVGTDTDAVFDIDNTGIGALSLPATDRVEITGDDEFSVFADPAASIAGGGSSPFTIRFSPLTVGSYSAIVSISNNDADENPYTFIVTGSATAFPEPEIDVVQGANPVLNGSTYDFGGMTVGATPVDIVFDVKNLGSSNLNLSGPPRVLVAPATDFSLFSDAAALIIPAGSSSFTLRFNASGAGTKNATVTIASDDADEPSYQFTVKAVGTSPDMNLWQDAANIPSGGNYNFTDVNVGASKQVDFRIANDSASSVLLLSGAPNMVTIAGPADFSVVQQPPASSIDPTKSSTFSIRYTPSGAGADNATVTVASNDKDTPYSFTIDGRGVNPDISVRDFSSTVVPHTGAFNFNNVKYNAPLARSFTVHNVGTVGDLHLKSTPYVVVSGTDAAFFTVTTQPASGTIAPAGFQSFTITFNQAMSSAAGAKSALVSVFSDDADTPVYRFTVNGTVAVPDIAVDQGVTPLADGAGVYNFADVNYGSAGVEVAFTITNSGTADLSLTGAPKVSLSNGTDFTVSQVPTPVGDIAAGGGTATFKITFSPALPLGAKTSTVTIVNDTPGAEGTYTFTINGNCVDSVAPVVSVTSPGGGTPHWRGVQNLTVSASDNVGVTQVDYYIDAVGGGNFLGSSVTGPNYTVSFDTTTKADGAHTIIAQAKDAVPNTGTSAAVNFVIDNTAPTINISAPSAAQAKNGTNVTYTVTYTDINFNSSSLAVGDITLNKTLTADGAVAVDGGTGAVRTVTISGVTGDGTLGISIAAGTSSDVAGNTAGGAGPSATFIADNTAPTVTIDSPAALTLVVAGSALNFTPSEPGTTNWVRIDAAAYATASSGATFGSLSGWGAAGTPFTVEIYCIDLAGNTGGSTTRSFTK